MVDSASDTTKGLREAAYVADSLSKGKNIHTLYEEFGNNRKLVDAYIEFARYQQWLEKRFYKKWHVTSRGKEWVSILLGAFVFLAQLPASLFDLDYSLAFGAVPALGI